MASIILPRRWQQQPQGVVELDDRHPIGRKCLFAYHPGNGGNPLVVIGESPKVGDYTGSAPTNLKYSGSPTGRVLEFHPFGGSNGVAGINTGVTSGSDVTMFWAGYPLTTDAAYLNVLNRGLTGDSMRLNASGACSYIDSSPAQVDCSVSQPVSVGRFEQIAFTKRGNNLKSYSWRSGATATATGGNGGFRSDGSNFFYVNHNHSGPNGHNLIQIVGAFQPLTDAEVEELFANPWQIFKPLRRALYFDGSSSTQFSVSVSDSAHESYADAAVLTSSSLILPDGTLHQFASDVVSLGLDTEVLANSTDHVATSDSIVASASVAVLVDGSTHATVADETPVSTNSSIGTLDSGHVAIADEVSISANFSIGVLDSGHATVADEASVSTNFSISVLDSEHATVADQILASTNFSIGIFDSAIAVSSESITFDGSASLSISDALNASGSDQVALASSSLLSVSAVSSSLYSDEVWVGVDGNIVTHDASSTSTSEHISPSTLTSILVDASLLELTSDYPSIYGSLSVLIDSASHNAESEEPQFWVNLFINVFSASHGIASQHISAQERKLLHVLAVAFESRILAVEHEHRAVAARSELRTLFGSRNDRI